MRALFDTSLLVAALVEAHPRHAESFIRLAQARAAEIDGLISAHSVAEAYAVLSALPVSPRITPSAAWALVEHSVLPYVETVDLPSAVVWQVVERLARRGLSGGVVYDALIAAAAQQGGAQCIFTLNPDDFRRVVESGTIDVRVP
ncbi:MAG: PIN domain-containing protein [Spirochaetales bacterium]|nr:PIN domain-containing protein [Spirochaetales bacterium]